MKVKLLKKLRKEIKRNLYICKNDSKFTLNHLHLITYLKDRRYRTEKYWGTITTKVIDDLYLELEHLALRGFIHESKRNT